MGHRPITGPVVRHDVDGPHDLLEDADGAPYPEKVQSFARYITGNLDGTHREHVRDLLVDALGSVTDALADYLPEAARPDEIDNGIADHEALRLSGVGPASPLGWSEKSVLDAHDSGSVWRDWLRSRADEVER